MKNNGRMISSIATQKEIAAFLKMSFNISKKDFAVFVRNARNNNYIWDCIDIDNGGRIIVYVVPHKMWIAIE